MSVPKELEIAQVYSEENDDYTLYPFLWVPNRTLVTSSKYKKVALRRLRKKILNKWT